MEIDPKSETEPVTKTLTPADRISDLNDIDKSITQLLAAASIATSVLSNSSQSGAKSLTDTQEAFRTASSDYFATLSSIEVRLRRQVYALEEAGLIPTGSERDTRRGRTVTTNNEGEDATLTNRRTAGGGALDPSWLNARASDSVEVRKRIELLAEGKRMLHDLQAPIVSMKQEDEQMDQGDG